MDGDQYREWLSLRRSQLIDAGRTLDATYRVAVRTGSQQDIGNYTEAVQRVQALSALIVGVTTASDALGGIRVADVRRQRDLTLDSPDLNRPKS